MNLKQLEVFIKVAESGSFSKGAEAAFITQSTVSQHICALESEFGLKLLDRTGKGARLTEGGKLLLKHARRVAEVAREIPLALGRFKGIEEAELAVAASSIPGAYMIPEALPLLLGRYPGIMLTLLQGDSRWVREMVLAAEVECGVVGGQFAGEGLEFTPFAKDELVLIAPAGHRWSGATAIDLEEVAAEKLLLREVGSGTGKAQAQALHGAGLACEKLRVAARLGSNEAVKRGVMAGLGVSFVSQLSVQSELALGALIRVEVAGIRIARDFYLVKRSGRELSPAAVAFTEVMTARYAGGSGTL